MELRGDKVKAMRMANNWTQQQLAQICDVNLRTIQRVEKQGNASLETIMALCIAFDVRREVLFEVPKPEELEGDSNAFNKAHFMFFVLGLSIGLAVALLALLFA
ncbi:helix-turn-helix domain-containing protein [Glaciecola sp. XM2]|jgi:transcriptional regulator with XRE-family HTH domain|uniref:helix-turn-helix transcriptional regulator n=1 Tax=Glaciecola sp. XM2 TaxID=1914931 RepID=UPI001BDE716D|nr:helix-turn-helix transcriptional regulator [Glaciecola sp. XM2]MBT1451529.1 helix-turn-helix domain-containing protein [Glaciecola sp. XM2]